MDRMFLIVVDAHSKWPQVFTVKQATSAQTVDMMRTLTHGFASTTGESESGRMVSSTLPQLLNILQQMA